MPELKSHAGCEILGQHRPVLTVTYCVFYYYYYYLFILFFAKNGTDIHQWLFLNEHRFNLINEWNQRPAAAASGDQCPCSASTSVHSFWVNCKCCSCARPSVQHGASASKGRLACALHRDLASLPLPQRPPPVCAAALFRGGAQTRSLPQAAFLPTAPRPGPDRKVEGQCVFQDPKHLCSYTAAGINLFYYYYYYIKMLWHVKAQYKKDIRGNTSVTEKNKR